MQSHEWKFDKRVLERNIRRGVIQRSDYEKHLKSLADLTDKTSPLVDDEAKRSAARQERKTHE